MIRRTISTHISPYLDGLAPETYDFVRYLNEEAKRLRTGVSFIALANRILGHGNLERALKFKNSLGAWLLCRAITDGFLAHRPKPEWETAAIEGEEIVLRRGNSHHRNKLRRLDKNRGAVEKPADNIADIRRVYAQSLREALESIYRKPKRPSHWNLKDYRRWNVRLRLRFGGFINADCQQGRPLRCIPVTPELAAFYLWLLQQLPTPEEQQLLERIGRLYKIDYWRPSRSYWISNRDALSDDDPALFDLCEWHYKGGSNWKHWFKAGELNRKRLEIIGSPRTGTVKLPRRDYQQLLADQPTYNARLASCWNINARLYRQSRTLNIPRATIDQRDNMIATLERDFTREEAEVS